MKRAKIKVELIDFTGKDTPDEMFRAARLMAFTKNTRLNMTPDGWAKFRDMPEDELQEELKYISRTIPTAWEFVNMTFSIQEVSRAAAQQITRTRWTPMEADLYGSYQMQSQRVTDVTEMPCYVPEGFSAQEDVHHSLRLGKAMDQYAADIAHHGDVEKARGLLPMGVACNLMAQYNLRTLSETCRKRSSLRVAGEFNEVVRQMREIVIETWPWSEQFFEMKNKTAIDLIEEVAITLPKEQKMQLAKAADMLKI